MTAECCGPALERVLSLGSKGLRSLSLSLNPDLAAYGRTLVRRISRNNFYVQRFDIDGLDDLEWEDGEDGSTGRCSDTLTSALKRNKRLEKETKEVTLQLLKLSRVFFAGSLATGKSGRGWWSTLKRIRQLGIETQQTTAKLLFLSRIPLLGSSAPSSFSSVLAKRPRDFRLPALPLEILLLVFSFVYPSALSDRQIGLIILHAAERTPLPPRIVEPDTLRKTRGLSGLNMQAGGLLLFMEKDEFLKETGCDRFDC